MAGFLRFVAFSALLLGVLELIVLPLALGPLLTSTVRDAGLRAQTIDVSVALLDPTLILGRARRVTLRASGVEVDPATIGQLEIGLENASYLDRTFETVSGEASDVTLTVGGDSVHVTSVTVNGPAAAANAVARLSAADTEQLVRLAARRAGVTIDRVDVRAEGVTVTIAGVQAAARVAVQGGALILDPGIGVAIVLLQPATSDAWSLTEAWTSNEGLNVRGTVNVARLSHSLSGRL